MAHTPGPWLIRKGFFVHTGRFPDDARLIATTYDREISTADAIDNARLVAAAPDLLQALIAARKVMQNDYHNKPRLGMERECEMADAAIAIAKGQP